VLPDDDRVEEVVRVPLRERGAVFGDGVDVLADAEDDALAERRRRSRRLTPFCRKVSIAPSGRLRRYSPRQ
jgi:hypothetical protein